MQTRKSKEDTVLYIVLPCYNEEEVLDYSAGKLLEKWHQLVHVEKLISEKSRILFVDDGSKDKTWEIINRLHEEHPQINGISLAHNRGHQNALLAGLMYAKEHCDVTISIDADLQQDINAMEDFLAQYYNGCEIVYGVRNSRKTDGGFKKITASIYYKLMKALGCPLYENAADYRLMSTLSLNALSEYSEVNLFLRGLIVDIGFKTGVVHFEVFKREYGESKYTLHKMIKLALDGITSFSVRPIRMVFILGELVFLISIGMIIFTIVDYLHGNTVQGWPTMTCSIWFLGGVQLLAIGIIGEYIGRNYQESKKRPRYFLQDILGDESCTVSGFESDRDASSYQEDSYEK